MCFLSYSKRLEVLTKTVLITEKERDMALCMCGKSSRDWSQTSLILSLSLIAVCNFGAGHLDLKYNNTREASEARAHTSK